MKVLYKNKLIDGNVIIKNDLIEKVVIDSLNENNEEGYILPGLIDLHTHGAMGFDFNTVNSLEDIKTITDFYVRHGVTSVFATVMTDDYFHLKKQLSLVGEAMKDNKVIKGIHLEGPFISSKCRGAHEEKYLLPLDISLFKELNECSGNNIRYITIAPELQNSEEFISYLVKNNIVVSLGHSDAKHEDVIKAIKCGASSFTHTFNAMTPFTHHNLTIAFSSLYIPSIYNEVIMDMKHVDPLIIKFLINNKGNKYIVGITDSLMCSGLTDGDYFLGEQAITLKNNECFLKGTLTRAGSCLNLLDGFKNYMKLTKYPIERAILPFSENAAKNGKIFNKVGSIKEGKVADLVYLDKDLNVIKTVVNGKVVYLREN